MKRSLSVFFLCCLAFSAHAQVQLNPLFCDHMVLQRGAAVPVWGTASPGQKVTVVFASQKVDAVSDAQGRWKAQLAPMPANGVGADLVVTGPNAVAVKDVVVGDVWLAGGQSNMDSPLRSGASAEAIPQSADPLIRFFNVKKEVAVEPQAQASGKWELSSPETSPNVSAVAWFFAREIRHAQGVPVGVISAAWGGTPIKTWMGLETFRREPTLDAPLAEWNAAFAKHQAAKNDPQLMARYYEEMGKWAKEVETPYKAAIKAYNTNIAEAKVAGTAAPEKPRLARPEPEMPDPLAHPAPSKRPGVPSHAFNGMIAPLVPYALKGVIWYQGEADISHAQEYRQLFPRLIEGWRALWGGSLPFLFVQLPGNGRDDGPVASQGIPFLRDAQASALAIPATGMAVTLDIGEAGEVHPDNKVHVGRRLALVAREKVYGEQVESSGPVYHSHEVRNGVVRVSFDHLGGGLAIGQAPWRPKNAAPLPADKLLGFAICGKDGKWAAADARIEGKEVVLSHPSIPEPVGVAYGWSATPAVNLYNEQGLPAAPFKVGPTAP